MYGKIKDGEVRIRSAFLWFPKIINGECRWLTWASWYEVAEINREWVDPSYGHGGGDWIEYPKWCPLRWVIL